MTYDTVATFSQVALLLIFFIALFIGVLIYAFWPGNRRRFDEAQRSRALGFEGFDRLAMRTIMATKKKSMKSQASKPPDMSGTASRN